MKKYFAAMTLLILAACGNTKTGNITDGDSVLDAATADTKADTLVDVEAFVTDDTPAAEIDAVVPDTGQGETGYFPSDAVWYQDISKAKKDSESDTIITNLAAAGGWGNGNIFQIDFSIEVLIADTAAPHRNFEPTEDFFEPDCDAQSVPVPVGGVLEGETGYACTHDGDCHLIVVAKDEKKLYEMWRANIDGNTFYGGCLVVWDLSKVYALDGRGDQCTSADAAGYPIAPLLFTADEVTQGAINHAIRFILPNSRIRHGEYVHPATHSTNPASGGSGTIPYGARLRLKESFDVNTLPSEGARVVARALKKYGMFLADGGEIALTAQADRLTQAKWENILKPRDLSLLKVTDFEMVEGGQRITYTGDCVRK